MREATADLFTIDDGWLVGYASEEFTLRLGERGWIGMCWPRADTYLRRGRRAARGRAVTKTWCTEFEQEVSRFVGDVAGPETMLANRVSRNVTNAPAYTIMGGTTQILRNIIGERILRLPREPRVPRG